MFEWLIPRLIVGTVKLTAFLIRKLVRPENLSPDRLLRGFRQGLSGQIKPDRADLVDGGSD